MLHVPDLVGNLFSVKCATRQGYDVNFASRRKGSRLSVLREDGSALCSGSLRGCGLYTLDMGHHACTAHANTSALELAQLWHRRLGHVAFGTLAEMARKGLLGECRVTPAEFLQARDRAICEPCVLGKLPRNPYPARKEPRTARALQRGHADVWHAGVPAAGRGGALYALVFLEDSRRHARVKLLRTKCQVEAELRRIIAWYETQTGESLQRLLCDRGGEFLNGELQAWLADKGIQVELTSTNCHQSNGVIERFMRTLGNKVRSMLADADMPAKWWGDAMMYACDTHNALLGRGSPTSPHEGLFGRRPDVSQFRVFGCRAWVHVTDKPGRKKLGARALRGRFLGFEGPMTSGVFRVLLDDGRITNSRTVVFSEPTEFPAPAPAPQAAPDAVDEESGEGLAREPAGNYAGGEEPGQLPQEPAREQPGELHEGFAEGPAEEQPEPQEPAADPPQTHAGRAHRDNFGVPPLRFAYSALARLGDQVPTRLTPIAEEPHARRRRRRDNRRLRRRSQRYTKTTPPTRVRSWRGMQPHRALAAEFHDSPPRSVAAALSRPDAAKWRDAIDAEVASCMKHDVWEPCDLPPGKQALPSHFIFEIKRDGRYKGRLVVGGNHQQHGVDYEETYAPTCAFRTLRMLLAVCAKEDLEMRQFDVKTAFLHGELEEEVYMRQPAGVELGRRGQVLRLRRALYGLKQAGRAWHKQLASELLAKGFEQSNSDPGLWILRGEGGAVLAVFYVDDGLVATRTAAEADALVAMVGSIWEIKEMGEPRDMLGITITRDRQARTITIHQADKARGLAEAAGVAGQSRPVPMSPEVFAGLRAATDGEAMGDGDAFRSQLGMALHMEQCTRPDCSLVVHALAPYARAPSQAHCDAMLNLIRYMGGTAERGITYGRTRVPVKSWCDSNFASCLDTRRSITGWGVTMYGGAVSWSSKKQPTTAASTMEAEYQACGAVAREGISLRKAFDELALLSGDFPISGPLSIFCDNQAALTLCKDRKEGQRVKHIDIIHHFARDRVASGELQFVYCKSVDNVSDCFTKALPKATLETCLVGLGMLPV